MHNKSRMGAGLQCRSCVKMLVCIIVTMQLRGRVVHGLLSSTGVVRQIT